MKKRSSLVVRLHEFDDDRPNDGVGGQHVLVDEVATATEQRSRRQTAASTGANR